MNIGCGSPNPDQPMEGEVMKKHTRYPMDFQKEAEQVLKPVHNLFVFYNTHTFVSWWFIFGIAAFISQWIPTPFNWVVLTLTFGLTMVKTYKYYPATSGYLHNVRQMRRLADEARQNFSRDDIVPSRMSWKEILLGIGRPSRRVPLHVRDYDADWCLDHQELLMMYINTLPREVQERRRQRRAEQRNRRRLSQLRERRIETPPVMPAVMGAARSVMLQPEHRVKIVRPVAPKPHREYRPRAQSSMRAAGAMHSASGPRLRRLEDVAELLNLADVLPPDVDHEHVRGIIIWGCLNPGKRGKTMVQAQYTTEQNARKNVRNKLGHTYNPEEFEAALAWLRRTRVVISDHKRKRHQPVLALNPHYTEGIDVGQVAIKRVLAAKDRITQLTAS